MKLLHYFKKRRLSVSCEEVEEYCSLHYVPVMTEHRSAIIKYSICDSGGNDKTIPSTEEILYALKMRTKTIDATFVDKLMEYIRERQLRESSVYKAAQIDRRLFSKIISDRTYKPAKDTCIALVMALRLDPIESAELLSCAGYTLSHSSRRDVIIEFFIHKEIYDLNTVNEILYHFGEKTLGR